MSVLLSKLLNVVANNYSEQSAQLNITINAINIDSRKIKPGDLFIAYRGSASDGRDYIRNALELGAVAVLYESTDYCLPSELVNSYPQVAFKAIPELKNYVSSIVSEFYDNPSQNQHIYAITGTNGKTSCAYMLAQLLSLLNNSDTGLIGTLGYSKVNTENSCFSKLDNTTPDPVLTQQILAEFRDDNIKNVALEASSHALEQKRLNGVNISTAIFTNLSHDHLDYHLTLENYYLAKRKLFYYDSVKYIVINIDDPYGFRLLADIKSDPKAYTDKKIIVYNIFSESNFNFDLKLQAENNLLENKGIDSSVNVLSYDETKNLIVYKNQLFSFDYKLIGRFNIYNLLAITGALLLNNYKLTDILKYTGLLNPAPGRLEVFVEPNKNIRLVVDYAHTPDALQKSLQALNDYPDKNNVWCIFGCGGDRDKTKRPEMAAVAVQNADKVIITDDNPRTESPEKIIEDIKMGIDSKNSNKLFAIIHSRRDAIRNALLNASPNDVVLIAGKGHEDYQIYGTEYIDYNEREFVANLVGVK